eukprot:m.227016 g.227016  ORF g.227016 m.227016 type:complete len:236 (-) comp17097_c0_seq1:182-889(-)
MAAQTSRWGDEVEQQDLPKLPRPKTVVEEGKKTVISYSRNDEGKIEKKTQVFRTEVRKEMISEAAAARRTWTKFGEAKGQPAGPSPATTSVGEDVFLELKSSKQLEEAEPQPVISESTTKCRNCGGDHFTFKCPNPQRMTETAPPVQTKPQHDDSTTVRVSNLSDDTDEQSLRKLFSTCGYVNRVFIVTDRVTGRSRGFAYVSFSRRDEAQKAVEKLNGQGFDYTILRVEFSQRD